MIYIKLNISPAAESTRGTGKSRVRKHHQGAIMMMKIPAATQELVCESKARALSKLLDQLFEVNELVGKAEFPQHVADLLRGWVPYNSCSLFEFSLEMQPRTIFSVGERYDTDMIEYLSGMYLVDPIYETYTRNRKLGVFLFNVQDQGEADMSASYYRYWKKLYGQNEIGTLMPVSSNSCVHMSVFLSLDSAEQTRQAMRFFEILHAPLTRMFKRHLSPKAMRDMEGEESRRRVHKTVSDIMASFGADVLTAREKEIAQFLLKGQSAKSIAQVLEISPGTAAIHRSNIYRKLDVSGQGEMFAKFVARLVNG